MSTNDCSRCDQTVNYQKCSKPNVCCPNDKYNKKDSIRSECCYVNADERQSVLPGQYNLQNYYACSCIPTQAVSIAIDNPTMSLRDGYGWIGQRGCLVKNDSKMRNGSSMTRDKIPQQLFTRSHLTTPYMGRGAGDPCSETYLKEGEDTFQNRPCNNLAGISTLGYQMTPLISCLKDVQNPNHIIPELNSKDWIRGGYPSRQWIRNQWYCHKCKNKTRFCRCGLKNVRCPSPRASR
jgi:hypothetical protein